MKLFKFNKEDIIVSNDHQPTNPFKDYESGGIAVGGFLILGIGIGLLFKPWYLYIIPGAVIGLGVGLIAMAVLSRDRYK
jgi:hypothetical protein